MSAPDLLENWTKPSPAGDGKGGVFVNPLGGRPTVLVAAVGAAEGARAAAAALACAAAAVDEATLLIDAGGKPPRPTLLASAAAQRLEERLSAHLPERKAAARGQFCHLEVPADPEGLKIAAAAVAAARGTSCVVHVPPPLLQGALADSVGLRPSGVLLRADLPSDRPLVALAVGDLLARGFGVGVLKRRLSWIVERRALFGALPAGSPGGLPERLVHRLLPPRR
jgi:hypothetical protein